jgi:hypothetical protein
MTLLVLPYYLIVVEAVEVVIIPVVNRKIKAIREGSNSKYNCTVLYKVEKVVHRIYEVQELVSLLLDDK